MAVFVDPDFGPGHILTEKDRQMIAEAQESWKDQVLPMSALEFEQLRRKNDTRIMAMRRYRHTTEDDVPF